MKSEKEQDNNLHTLLPAAKQFGLALNSDKCSIKQPQIQFFDTVYDKDGVHPYPDKTNMPDPADRLKLQEFLGIVTYISPFIPGLSDNTAHSKISCKKKQILYAPHHTMMPRGK